MESEYSSRDDEIMFTVLKRINKRAKVGDNYGALLTCQTLGIPVRCSLMFGNPGE